MAQAKKDTQLGMPHGTATARLKKNILFELVKRCSLDTCYQCKKKITDIKTFSVEHKTPWLDSEDPVDLFFNLDNIAFSHLKCNMAEARIPHKGKIKHPSHSAYRRGCRCDECKELSVKRIADYRVRRKALTGKDR